MDIGKIAGKIPKWLQQYRYPLLILLVGLVLLTVPGRKNETPEKTTQQPQAVTPVDTSELLVEVLEQIHGVGKVKVMLSISAGETTLYHKDENISTADGTSSVRQETVIITDSERKQQPLITQIIPAKYQGAVVVCQGADDPIVKLAVVEAVSKATGLGANQISVLKMK